MNYKWINCLNLISSCYLASLDKRGERLLLGVLRVGNYRGVQMIFTEVRIGNSELVEVTRR